MPKHKPKEVRRMFSGMSNHSIDSKGRIVLPAKFREELGESFYLARGFGNNCVQAMSSEQFDSISAKIMTLPADKAMALQYIFTATAVEVSPNAQGRVIIPQTLREFAGLESDALVIGMNNRIEIWSKSRFDEYIASKQDTIAEALALLTF
ncbi:MAG: division/cell wall cluster transcriptional repressor MraZ [Ruminococcus sp.]|nr:division/cell wall cluster transcriptional repressor MraZ [Ruminococcus sp.]